MRKKTNVESRTVLLLKRELFCLLKRKLCCLLKRELFCISNGCQKMFCMYHKKPKKIIEIIELLQKKKKYC